MLTRKAQSTLTTAKGHQPTNQHCFCTEDETLTDINRNCYVTYIFNECVSDVTGGIQYVRLQTVLWLIFNDIFRSFLQSLRVNIWIVYGHSRNGVISNNK
jgi:hypothetical protein